jgi:hypothetical protein
MGGVGGAKHITRQSTKGAKTFNTNPIIGNKEYESMNTSFNILE